MVYEAANFCHSGSFSAAINVIERGMGTAARARGYSMRHVEVGLCQLLMSSLKRLQLGPWMG